MLPTPPLCSFKYFSPGDRIDSYEIVRRLDGGNGEFYLGRHLEFRKDFVLQIVRLTANDAPETAEQLLREVRAAAGIRHPKLISVCDVRRKEEDGLICIVQEHLEGITLKEMLKGGPLPPERTIDVALKISSALLELEQCSLLHWEINPAHILLSSQGEVKLIVPAFKVSSGDVGSPAPPPENFGDDLNYTAPEQLRDGENQTFSSAVYSLGVTLWQMLSGKIPFAGDSAFNVIANIFEQPLTPLVELDPRIPPELSELIAGMTSKEPAERPMDGTALHRKLLQVKSSLSDFPHRKKAADKSSFFRQLSDFLLTVTALVLLAVAARLFYEKYVLKPAEEPEKSFPVPTGQVVKSVSYGEVIDRNIRTFQQSGKNNRSYDRKIIRK